MISEIDIVEATNTDLGTIAKIHRAARQAAMPWLPDIHTPEENLWIFTNIVFAKESLLVAREGPVILGFASYMDGWLNHLYVAPAHWRKGVGAKLLAAARVVSPALQLWTFQQNHAAQRFYEAHGFLECERTDRQGNEEKTPDVRMECRVGFYPTIPLSWVYPCSPSIDTSVDMSYMTCLQRRICCAVKYCG